MGTRSEMYVGEEQTEWNDGANWGETEQGFQTQKDGTEGLWLEQLGKEGKRDLQGKTFKVSVLDRNPPANDGNIRSGRSPGRGHGNALQSSCLENLMDRRAWPL